MFSGCCRGRDEAVRAGRGWAANGAGDADTFPARNANKQGTEKPRVQHLETEARLCLTLHGVGLRGQPN